MTNEQKLLAALGNLTGTRLSSTHYSLGFRVMHFGTLVSRGNSWVGEVAIHILCPWRLAINDKLVTGSGDWWYDRAGNWVEDSSKLREPDTLQSRLLEEPFPRDPTKITLNPTGSKGMYAIDPAVTFLVVATTVSKLGDLRIELSGGARIDTMLDTTPAEQWRILFPRDRRRRHICVHGPGNILLD